MLPGLWNSWGEIRARFGRDSGEIRGVGERVEIRGRFVCKSCVQPGRKIRGENPGQNRGEKRGETWGRFLGGNPGLTTW